MPHFDTLCPVCGPTSDNENPGLPQAKPALMEMEYDKLNVTVYVYVFKIKVVRNKN